MSPALTLGALLLLLSNCAFSQTEEQNAYCSYVTQEAMAQRNILRAPNAVGGLVKSNTGTQPQMYWGINNSLANYSKANLTMQAARKNCDAYRATTGASLEIQYALPRLERDALRHRIELLQQAVEQLDAIINRNLRLVEVQNLTRPMLYSVQSVRARLVADRMNAELKAALLYVPENASDVPLKQLVVEKQRLEAEAQKSSAALNQQRTWDVRLEGGGRQRLTPVFQNSVEPYGEVSFTYNFGSRSNDSHLEKATLAYTDWKRAQDGEVVHNAQVLEQQIRQSISVEQADLRALQEQQKELDGNLQRLVGVDTSAALGFGSQLDADKVVLQIDISDVTFRLQALQDYLENNF
jgi:hypothetical protein